MNISQFGSKTAKLIADNAPIILTGLGVAGTAATAYLTGRASYKAADVIRQEEIREKLRLTGEADPETGNVLKLTRPDKFKLLWKLYLPAAGVGALTVTSIVMANRISMKRTAAMAGALALADRAHTEYKDKVEQHFGKNKEQKVRDDIAQDRVNANPIGNQQVIMTGGGDSLCMDAHTGRYFTSSMNTLEHAVNEINSSLLKHDRASLSDFYNLIGLPTVKRSDEIGWGSPNLVELDTSLTMSEDQRPCIVVDFSKAPIENYHRMH